MTRPPNAGMYQTPLHLDATAQPRHTPASTRSQRIPRLGPPSPAAASPAAAAASRALVRSRSITSSPKAASTQNITKMSRIAVRLSTNSRPSSAISSPATQPSRVDRVIRRTILASSRMDSEPTSATENRQPNGVSPNSHSPAAIAILPSGGCATSSLWVPARMFVLPRTSSALAFLTCSISTPCRRMPHASPT